MLFEALMTAAGLAARPYQRDLADAVARHLASGTPVAVAVHGVCAAPLKATLAGQVNATVDDALVILQAPLTAVMAKFVSVPPLTTGSTAPEPTAGPTDAGLLVQLRVPVKAPVTAQAEGACDEGRAAGLACRNRFGRCGRVGHARRGRHRILAHAPISTIFF